MQARARSRGISIDFATGETLLTIAIKERPAEIEEQWNKLANKDLDLSLTIHREKRSLDANAYFHVLVTRIAEKQNQTLLGVKNDMITDYGQLDYIDGELVEINSNIPPETMREQEYIHVKACGVMYDDDGGLLFRYRVYRGSHTYDTKEMTTLIQGTVETAKELGIETMTPYEIARMMALYENKITKK